MDNTELMKRFGYHPPKSDYVAEAHARVRLECMKLALLLDAIVPVGREKSLMMTALEEVMMWGNAGIARNLNG